MSQENVELVRRAFEASARRDTAAVLALYDADVEWDASRAQGMEGAVYRGHDGLRRFFREWREAWDRDEYDYEELIDAGSAVVSVATQRGRGRASGLPIARSLVGVWTIEDGLIVRVVWFLDRDDALQAAGLRE
jgi:ketosteroid isomerase-like protein